MHSNVFAITALAGSSLERNTSLEECFPWRSQSTPPRPGIPSSGLWIQLVSSQAGYRMTSATFRYTLCAYLGLPQPGCFLPDIRSCPACHMQTDALGTHWVSTFSTFRSALTRWHASRNRTTQVALHRAGYSTTVEPRLLDPILDTGNAGLRPDISVSKGRPYWRPCALVCMPVTRPRAPPFASRAQSRHWTAAVGKYHEEVRKYEWAVDSQSVSAGFTARY